MSLDPATRSRIEAALAADRVVLFMKGRRGAPRCGFSATVCDLLDRLLPDYQTVDVLEDPALREGIKLFSEWPTIPQLYVDGEFVGGCDIVQEMFQDGSLPAALGVAPAAAVAPRVALTPAAAAALGELAPQAGGRPLHLRVDARFQSSLYFGPEEPGELRVETGGVALLVDPLSAGRADGVVIDALETEEGPAFRIDNPNAPQRVAPMSVQELKRRLDAGERFAFFDVRTPEERATASIPGARLLDAEAITALEALDRDAMLVFHCHHGGRSRAAAEHFAGLGFRNVWNVEGGIDAWSREIDAAVPRY